LILSVVGTLFLVYQHKSMLNESHSIIKTIRNSELLTSSSSDEDKEQKRGGQVHVLVPVKKDKVGVRTVFPSVPSFNSISIVLSYYDYNQGV